HATIHTRAESAVRTEDARSIARELSGCRRAKSQGCAPARIARSRSHASLAARGGKAWHFPLRRGRQQSRRIGSCQQIVKELISGLGGPSHAGYFFPKLSAPSLSLLREQHENGKCIRKL